MEYWPLNAFIATNPLWSLRHNNFFDIVQRLNINALMPVNYYYNHYLKKNISDNDLKNIFYLIKKRTLSDKELNRWIKSSLNIEPEKTQSILFCEQLEEYQFQKPIIWIKERIFVLLRDYFGSANYKKITLIDFWYKKNQIKYTEINNLKSLSVKEAISFIIKKMNIPTFQLLTYLENIYLNIYGWSSLMNWRNQHTNNPWIPGKDECEIILLMWLSYEYSISIDTGISYKNSYNYSTHQPHTESYSNRAIWHLAFEKNYFNKLESKINKIDPTEKDSYAVQFIFCIDTRSEGFRRHLEINNSIQTFGFAGFFGAIFNLDNEGSISYQAPALVESSDILTIYKKYSSTKKILNILKKVISCTKKQFMAPFALFEMIGFWFLPYMIFKTIQPTLPLSKKNAGPRINNILSEETQFQAAYNLLNTIGLIKNFSPIIFLCAHQSDTINNPYKSSLNCGACGGNSGVPNAIIMCNILNNRKIREKLKDVSIIIPDNTKFIAACHHTVDDRLEIFNGYVPPDIIKIINSASESLKEEKKSTLPGYNSLSKREKNWSELIPELGLINNASMIIGPRNLTRGQDLKRRAFLHSYEPNIDHNGDILTSILSAPAIVAHWINSQYYFSTVNPYQFGAGNKAIHNVLPNIGVLEGNLSDLKIGLPLQSTHFCGEPIHEPKRIIIVVYATKNALDKAIKNSPDFKLLLDNHWIQLKHIEANLNACLS